MEDKLNKKQRDWIKANQGILRDIFEIRKEEVKSLVMMEEDDKRREVLREMYWEYEHIWLPLLFSEEKKPRRDDGI